MKNSDKKGFGDPGYTPADFKAELFGGGLRWVASVFAVGTGGFFVWLLTHPEDREIRFIVHLEGISAVWFIACIGLFWTALAIVNWINWLKPKTDGNDSL